jgi:uncharacterized delta-60 repeat protein
MSFRRSQGVVAATLALVAISLFGCTGLPDTGFASGGIKVLPDGADLQAYTLLANGDLMASTANENSTDNLVFRFKANGAIDTTYADHGVLTPGPGQMTVAPDGRAFRFVNTVHGTTVSVYTAEGSVDSTFAGGSINLPTAVGPYGSAVSTAGDLYLWSCSDVANDHVSCSLHRYNKAGQQDPTFVAQLPIDTFGYVTGFGPGGTVLIVGYSQSIRAPLSHFVLSRVTATGAPDSGFGSDGSVVLPPKLLVKSVAVDRSSKVSMVVAQGSLQLVLRFTALGQADRTFGWLGMAAVPQGDLSGSLTVDVQGRVILTASGSAAPSPVRIVRYLANGQLDPKFGYAGQIELSKVGGVSLLDKFVLGVSTDASSRPVLWLNPGYSTSQPQAPAIVRLTG